MMAPREPLDAALGIFDGDARARDVALFRVAEDVLRSLEDCYGPPKAPAFLDACRGMSLESLQKRVEDPAFALLFGQFRSGVLEHEERAARRLTVLLSTARTLTRLQVGAKEPERLAGMCERLGRFVAERWRMDLNLDEPDRDWALRVSRRYDLLPPSWRSV